MIRRLKTKFILLALTSLFVLLAVIVIGMNLLNYRSVIDEADETLALLSQNEGVFPLYTGERPLWLPSGMSLETPYESRYFSVVIDENVAISYVDTSNIYSVGTAEAIAYAREVWDSEQESGFVDRYRFVRSSEDGQTRMIFLDCGRKLDMFHDFVRYSILISLVGYAVIALIICFVAVRFVRPVAESYERQKRFITDAGHEIKTPLTIISANVDLLQMDQGENESLDEIRRQTQRLTGLTNDLVYLSRIEESRNTLPMVEFPVSEVVLEAASPFEALAQSQGKELLCNVQPLLSMRGNDKAVSRLVSILLDNAMKYSSPDSRIELQLVKQGHRVFLIVSNPIPEPIPEESLRHVFERFYRTDASRNSETGGHGIGLSMAAAIVEEHDGKIGAMSPNGQTFTVTASFPD